MKIKRIVYARTSCTHNIDERISRSRRIDALSFHSIFGDFVDRYVIELGGGLLYSIRKYLAKTSGRKPDQVSHSDVVNEFLIPVLTQVQDNLRTVSKCSGDWSIHVYRVKKVRSGYKYA